MQKSDPSNVNKPVLVSLQCGRIYKDAEIRRKVAEANDWNRLLQCGRIYKDAEIADYCVEIISRLTLQCGRIYKDAEIRCTQGS